MIRLAVAFRDTPSRSYAFKQERIRIGRLPTNDVVLENLALSRHHAEIVAEDGAWVLRDLGSSNGTYVNGKRVAKHSLRGGDVVGIGKFTIAVTIEAPPPGGLPVPLAPLLLDERLPWDDEGAPGAHLVVKRGEPMGIFALATDAFHVGGHRSCELRLPGALAPRRLAILVRGLGGYSIVNVTNDPEAVWKNGKPVASRAWLEDGDKLELGGLLCRFQRAASRERVEA
jgi:pSer/pThr/pTyr-binding forkhead associated (FHA) protein